MRLRNCVRLSTLFAGFIFLLCFSAGRLLAQTFNLQTDRQPIASLDDLWRFHTGDNPAWASPNFDDSQWPLLRSGRSWNKQGFPNYSGYAWYRFMVQVPDGSKPVALMLTEIVSGYQVYADGKLIGSAGSATSTRDPVLFTHASIFQIPIGSAGPRSIQIALRVWEYKPETSWIGGGPQNPRSAVGDPFLLTRHLHLYQEQRAWGFVNEYAYGLLAAVVGITILGLFLFRSDDREYLWFAVLLLSEAASVVFHLLLNLGSMPFPLWRLLGGATGGLSVVAALAFFSIVLHARRSFLWWTACIAAAASSLTVALFYFQWTGIGISFAVTTFCLLPAYIWIIVQLAIGALRKDTSARLLFIPAALFYGFDVIGIIPRILWQLGGADKMAWVDIPLMRYPFSLSLGDVIGYIFVLALLIFLVRRFSLARQEETRLSTEMESARSIQSLLVPATAPSPPGFAVESVYLPASEVGGDFFQILPGDDGSLLVVVGDVSGKGLKAAMTVSTIIGALRDYPARRPAEILAHLNRVLQGQIRGFVTCCATVISADGELTIANAGHLSPYRDGEELTVVGGLPLGILVEGPYEETRHRLTLGDRLTFVSDGVVEARDPNGELYGFERTGKVSTRSATAIAETAKQFGQEDDITVVAIQFMGTKAAVSVVPEVSLLRPGFIPQA